MLYMYYSYYVLDNSYYVIVIMVMCSSYVCTIMISDLKVAATCTCSYTSYTTYTLFCKPAVTPLCWDKSAGKKNQHIQVVFHTLDTTKMDVHSCQYHL